ncbi:circularly permuted type 2 ATP-grasp protein [Candidatus Methylacidiphilum infernorum]|uniref:Circularly permuted type 2 ATP-grasp protein n=2 Tax=Candidatus Methylacidiphilum infernorum TaxID=511746 RepID=A0ABX7PU14_9BACT|nr:circularly permuted type 2 ATP-grasp protein [Candidatus Methylacidiphilum infernorum]
MDPFKVEIKTMIGQNCYNLAASLTEENLDMVQKALSLHFELMGIFPNPLDKPGDFSIDPWPILLCQEDWMAIRSGVEQRMEAWGKFLKDLYSEKKIFRDKIIPFEPFLSSSGYRRECVFLEPLGGEYISIFSCELAKEKNGNWVVLKEELAMPQNIMLAEEIRRALRKTLPELFKEMEPVQCFDYPERILEALSHGLPDNKEGIAALVTEKPEDWEAAMLARRMGVPLFLASDLIVLEGKLYAKTLNGLEPIAILLRRIKDGRLDPIATRCSIEEGIAGLFWCLRKSSLKLVNAAGSGIASDPLLQSQLSNMIGYYLGEKPLLSTLPSYPAWDPDVFALFLDSPMDYIIKDREGRRLGFEEVDQLLSEANKKRLKKSELSLFVLQEKLSFKPFPSFYNSSLEHKPCSLVFLGIVKGNQPELLPVVFGQVLQDQHTRLLLKDVWLFQESPALFPSLSLDFLSAPTNRIGPLSRVAESMYWLGRYLVRALQLNHILLSFRSFDNGFPPGNEPRLSFFLQEMADFFLIPSLKSLSFPDSTTLFYRFFVGTQGEDSVMNCFSRCFENGAKIRDCLPPEVWIALSSLYFRLHQLIAEGKRAEEDQKLADFSSGIDSILCAIDEHLLRNELWKFFQLGRFYEKARFSVFLTRLCSKLIEREEPQGYDFLALLEGILKLSSALYAYRSLYHYPFSAEKIIALFLFDSQFPRSISFCLNQIESMLGFIEKFPGMPGKPLSFLRYMIAKVGRWADEWKETGSSQAANKDKLLIYKPWIEQIQKELFDFHLLLTDSYFTHQSTLQCGAEPAKA